MVHRIAILIAVFSTMQVLAHDLMVSLMWEGDRIRDADLERIEAFRDRFPKIRLMHFIDPAYFLKDRNKSLAKSSALQIRGMVREGDSVGLHLHPWKSTVEAARVSFRREPTFWGNSLSRKDCLRDCGHEVSLAAYTRDEVHEMVSLGVKLFRLLRLPRPVAFMAGGWMGSSSVLSAVLEAGIHYDFSAVSTGVVAGALGPYPLYNWLENLWGQVPVGMKPVRYQQKDDELIAYGQNFGTIDHSSVGMLIQRWKRLSRASKRSLVHVGFYQETASQNLGRLEQFLLYIHKTAAEQGIVLKNFQLPKEPRKVRARVDVAMGSVFQR